MTGFKNDGVYCCQAFVGMCAWLFVLGTVFSDPVGGTSVDVSVATAGILGFLSTGIWLARCSTSIAKIALAYSAVPIAWALFCSTDDSNSRSLAFWCGVAFLMFLAAALGGWLSRKTVRRIGE